MISMSSSYNINISVTCKAMSTLTDTGESHYDSIRVKLYVPHIVTYTNTRTEFYNLVVVKFYQGLNIVTDTNTRTVLKSGSC